MRQLALLAAFLLIFGLTFGMAEELTLSGSVEWSMGDDDIKEAPGFDFDGSKTGAVATLKIGSMDGNVEAGVTLNLLPTITKTDGVDIHDDVAGGEDTDNFYDVLQNLCDWAHYKINGKTYLNDAGGQTAWGALAIDPEAWDSVVGANEAIITGTGPWTVTDLDDLTKTDTLSAEIWDTVQNAHADFDGLYSGISLVDPVAWAYVDHDTTHVLEGTAAEVAAAEAMQDHYEDYQEDVFEAVTAKTDDSWANAFPITSAYLNVKNVFGVLDFMAEIEGRAVGVGSMVTSDATAGNDANVGLTVGLSDGVVDGLSFSVLVTTSDDGAAAVDQDYETAIDDVEAAEEPVWGMLIEAGYDAGIVAADVGFGLADLSDTAAYIAGLGVGVSMPDMAGLAADVELNLVGGDDMGLGVGASVGAGIMGISPTVGVYWKNEFFGDDDTDNDITGADTIEDEEGMMAEFDSTKASLTALGIDVAVDLADLMGMKLLSLSGGYDMILSGNSGWDVGVGLDLAEVLGMPVTVGFDISKWAEEDLIWAAVLGYTYSSLGVSLTVEQTEEDVVGWSLAGKVTF
jgi:hypothetical protein